MNKDYEKKYHEIEKKHFWFRSRRNYILNFLKQFPKDNSILDIGCSSGILITELVSNKFSIDNLYGVDISSTAIQECEKNKIYNSYIMDAQNIQLDKKFDILIASDCLEHLKDDKKALQNWYELLKRNGTLIVFVPAFMSLWSEHDDVNNHYRRYLKKDLENKLKSEGFIIEKSSYWNFLLFIPTWIYRKIDNRFNFNKKNAGNLKRNPVFNHFLYKLIMVENYFLSKYNLPFGVSTFCIARKPEK